MSALYWRVADHQWQVAITHIQSHVADQIFYQSGSGYTAIMRACMRSPPLELIQLTTKVKLDSRKRCLLAITSNGGNTALHYAAINHSIPAVLKLMMSEHPLALQTTNSFGNTPQQLPTIYRSLLTDTTKALTTMNYARLIALVGTSDTLESLAGPEPMIAALACLARSNPTVRVNP